MLKKAFGQIDMKWWKVILFAVIMGVYTGLISLWVPPANWYHSIAETLERWVLPTVWLIVNCKKPLEAALKTFVFYLISQPLVYLIQVPFAEMGWGLFGYYRYWFYITLLTFPGAFIGWFIKKNNILSGLILSVVLVILAMEGVMYLKGCLQGEIGNNLGGLIYCVVVIFFLTFVILSDWKAIVVALVIPIAAFVIFFFLKVAGHNSLLTIGGYLDKQTYPITFDWSAESSAPDIIKAEVKENGAGEPDLIITVYKEGETEVTLTDAEGKTYKFDASYDKERESDFILKEATE